MAQPETGDRGTRDELPGGIVDSFVRYSSDAVTGVDLDGRVTSWNPACESVLGVRSEDALGTILPFVPPEFRSRYLSELRGIVASGRPASREREVVRGDGARMILEIVTIPIADAKGRGTGAYTMLRDAALLGDVGAARSLLELLILRCREPLDALGAGVGLISRADVVGNRQLRADVVTLLRANTIAARSALSDVFTVLRLATGQPSVDRGPVDVTSVVSGLASSPEIGIPISLEFALDTCRVSGEAELLGRALELSTTLFARGNPPPGEPLRIALESGADEVVIEVTGAASALSPADFARTEAYFEDVVAEPLTAPGVAACLIKGIVGAHGGTVMMDLVSRERPRVVVRIPSQRVEEGLEEIG